MRFQFKKIIIIFIVISALIMPNFIFSREDLEKKCLLLAEQGCQESDSEQCRKELEECEEYYKKESERISADLSKTEQEKNTLKNKVNTLNQKITNLNYQIYQSNLVIKDLGFQIEDTEDSIYNTSLKIEDSKDKLTQILKTIYEKDQQPMIEILLSEADLSDFFDDLIALEILNERNKELLQSIKTLKTNLEEQRQDLDQEKDNLEKTVETRTLQRDENAKTKKEQEHYYKLTEQEYQKQLEVKKATEEKAAAIRARIFELVGIPKAPTFGEALEIAEYIEKITGIRPAFLLAILTQESNIGKNVGQCYLKDSKTGSGTVIKSGATVNNVMKPSRDVDHFLTVTKELGRDPYATPVSCPMSYGWGGAMGPAQFIPSTWMIYRDKVKELLDRPGDPWNIKDAFLAAALYLTDYGADKRTYNGEWKAAMIYFSGTSQRTKYNGYGFYGDSVMKIAAQYEEDIKAIK